VTLKVTHLLKAFFKCDFSYSYVAVKFQLAGILLQLTDKALESAPLK